MIKLLIAKNAKIQGPTRHDLHDDDKWSGTPAKSQSTKLKN